MQKSSVEILVGVFVLIGIMCVGYLAVKLGQMEFIGSDYYTVNARFLSVTGLKSGARVEIAGVEVGRVDDISLDKVRQIAIVRLKIHKDVALSEDVIASIKTSGLIGDKFIKLSPGGSEEELKQGDMITETESSLDIEDLISKYVFGGVK
ncbi:MAG: outer membrane lipid asymmetry maintenance protein MlaD [Desulfobacterales bacterium]|nr:outer membrane lipid asymmetry maintenance protein MlaD [Desulfobacterales bacterium]